MLRELNRIDRRHHRSLQETVAIWAEDNIDELVAISTLLLILLQAIFAAISTGSYNPGTRPGHRTRPMYPVHFPVMKYDPQVCYWSVLFDFRHFLVDGEVATAPPGVVELPSS